jgi:hypothetical protein
MAPRVRAWIDPCSSESLDTEFEIALRAAGSHAWSGTFCVEASRDAGFYYRIGIAGARDAHWSLQIRDVGSGRILHRDGDELSGRKTWLLGTCVGARAATRPEHRRLRLRSNSAVVCLDEARAQLSVTADER